MSRKATGPATRDDGHKPVILALDDDPQVLRAVRRDLRTAYADRYAILTVHSSKEGMKVLDTLAERRQELALFLVDQRMPDVTGLQFLLEAMERFPEARRVLLTAYAETDAAIVGINQVGLDHYLLKPWGPPQERLYPVLDRLLEQWWSGRRTVRRQIQVIGHAVSSTTRAVREFLTRNGQPFSFLDAVDVDRDSEIGQLLTGPGGVPGAALPVVLLPDGMVMFAPTEEDLAEQLGWSASSSLPHYECVIVGAGPTGLSAAVHAASEGLRTLLLDAQPNPGGQSARAPLIENYLGFPSGLSGEDLTRRAAIQAVSFGAELMCPAEVVGLRREDPAKIITLADGSEASAESVLLSPGATYRRLEARGASRFEGVGLYYGLSAAETRSCIAQRVLVVGGANTAGQAAVQLAKYASEVTLLVRAGSLSAKMSPYLADELSRTPNIAIRLRTTVREFIGVDRLERVVLYDSEGGALSEVETRFVFTFIGAHPHTDWLGDMVERDDRGFVLTGSDLVANGGEVPSEWSLERAPYPLETSIPGVFAAGDARAHSVKRVSAAVGEGAMAVDLIQRYRVSG
ncbi:FAD-dependent oxidoreductase [Streptacidiphilus sp. N1-3]|uniref:FAD-dependent oxidoreductase n=1 Tax=Streptacidiphilus alkalitolerans TaxID=3342712 RepID=A0ABV6WVZ3_9ACTN